ncbi:MAG: hypothetical protein DRI97_04635 [Bacteroidetes bacterium]|nr:MAG: hypothetical protein DRI97_04635 [Bacteroidota bacterium]
MTQLKKMPTVMMTLVANAATFGLTPLLVRGKKIIMTFSCPKCKGKSMIKFVKRPDYRNKIHACKDCGYRYMSPGWKAQHGTFMTGVAI